MGQDVKDSSRVCQRPPGSRKKGYEHLRPRTMVMAAGLITVLSISALSTYMIQNIIIVGPLIDSHLPGIIPVLGSAEMAYDSESDRIVFFGGIKEGSGVTDETWSYDFNTNTWTNMTPTPSPARRWMHKMIYDSESDLIIMGGGINGIPGDAFGDLWVYDLNSNTWTEQPSTSSPLYIYSYYEMIYDSSIDLVIFYGNYETWTYDVDTNTWENVTIASGPKNGENMVYDEQSGVVIQHCSSETWAYNSITNTWTEMNPVDGPDNGLMAYDSNADRVILFSGSETWAYSFETNTWSNRNPKIYPSEKRLSTPRCMVYDSESDRTILLSGDGASTGDIWAYSYNENEWRNIELVPDDDTFSFVAYGDTHGEEGWADSPLHKDIVTLYVQHDPEFILHTGDMIRHGGDAYQWLEFNESIALLWDHGIPLYGAAGNCEMYPNGSLLTYLDFIDYSYVVDQPDETELFYSFDENGIHFVILNTAQEWDDEIYTCPTVQMEWLEKDLAAGHEFIIVVFNYPVWSIQADSPDRWARAESIRNTYHSLFTSYGVDIVFNGHDNLYYRTVRDGINYVVTGGGGAPLAEIQTEDTVWQVGDIGFSDYHYCVAKDTGGQLAIEVFLINGTIADSFTLDLLGYSSTELVIIFLGVITPIAIVVTIVWLRKKWS